MSTVAERLAAAGFDLPPAPAAVGRYRPAVRTGNLVFTSGQLPFLNGELTVVGRVGETVGLQEATEAARICAANALAAASTVCDLDDLVGVVKLVGYVASALGFAAQPAVIDGASEVLLAAFGEAGTHAREAVGVAMLPLDAPVEVSVILSLGEMGSGLG